MPVTYFNNDVNGEQAKGATLDAGVMDMFAVRRDQPLNLISLRGHYFDEAPTYNVSEGKILPEYRVINGRNRIVEHQLSGDYIKSMSYTMQLPKRLASVTQFIFDTQNNCDYDLVFKPRNCPDNCDEFFWKNTDMKLSPKQITTSTVGFDDNEQPMSLMRTVKCSGSLIQYQGLGVEFLSTMTNAAHAVLVAEDDCDTGCGCPNQTIVRGGAPTALAAPDLEYTTDGGKTFTAITTTAIPVDTIITDIKMIGGYLVVSYSDVVGGTGTAGGVAYSLGIGGALTLATFDVASLGIQTMEVVGNKLYAFGTGGETYLSCDSGLSFVKNTDSPITETIIDSSYDNVLNVIFLSATTSEAWAFNQVAFTQIDGDFSPTAATDLESVEVIVPGGGVAFGGADGKYYETFNYGGLTVGDWVTGDFGTGTVGAIASDGSGYRTIVGHATDIQRRSITTNQDWREFSTIPTGNITAIESVAPVGDEGVNYFIAVTDAGETLTIKKCYDCLESC